MAARGGDKTMKKITVFLADDHAIFREGLRLLLQADEEIEVVAGAAGYVMKETASQELLHAIREISNGTAFFSPLIAMRLLQGWKNRELPSNARATQALTDRQRDVVQLIAEGYSNKQMATLLCISIKTVDKHRQSLMDKLNIHEVATLTRYAVSHGVVEAESYNHPVRAAVARVDGRSAYLLNAETPIQP
jgi:DNA-binding NarL/FixJ family response regulator